MFKDKTIARTIDLTLTEEFSVQQIIGTLEYVASQLPNWEIHIGSNLVYKAPELMKSQLSLLRDSLKMPPEHE